MNPEIKARWIAALRSGEYKQGPRRLKTQVDEDTVTHCCLGVLCELAVQDGVTNQTEDSDGFVRISGFDGATSTLPYAVMRWAGLSYPNPRTSVVQFPSSQGSTLSSLNDQLRYTFDQIADVIERDL